MRFPLVTTVRPWAYLIVVCLAIGASWSARIWAHNNPTFREDLLQTVMIDSTSAPNSSAFEIELPEKTVQLIWRITFDDARDAGVAAALYQGEEKLIDLVAPETATERYKGADFSLRAADGAGSMKIELYAKVLDRSKKQN